MVRVLRASAVSVRRSARIRMYIEYVKRIKRVRMLDFASISLVLQTQSVMASSVSSNTASLFKREFSRFH